MKVGRTIILTAVFLLVGTWAYAADCNNGGRYEDMGDGTVTDCRTGMIWLKNANCTDTVAGIDPGEGRQLPLHEAMKWAAGLHDGLCGLTDGSSAGDWRLPTITEWMAMVAYAKKMWNYPVLSNGAGTAKWTEGDVFNNVQGDTYLSSTFFPAIGDAGWNIEMNYGLLGGGGGLVWPVRAGQEGTFGSVFIE